MSWGGIESVISDLSATGNQKNNGILSVSRNAKNRL